MPFAVNFSKWIKTHPLFQSSVAMGWTAARFKDEFDSAWSKFRDPVVFWYDHSSFDASQTVELRKAVSIPFAVEFLDSTAPYYG